jgi:hypothetical protein
MIHKLIRWCLFIVYYRSNRFVVFECFNHGSEIGCCRFYLYNMSVLVVVYYHVTLVDCLLDVFLKGFRGIT